MSLVLAGRAYRSTDRRKCPGVRLCPLIAIAMIPSPLRRLLVTVAVTERFGQSPSWSSVYAVSGNVICL